MTAPKYRYADEVSDGNVPIQIMDGKFEGIMLRYDKVVLRDGDDGIHFDYEYDISSNPDDVDLSDPDFRDVLTAILLSVLDEQITNIPDDLDILKEGDSEEHRESNTSEPTVQ
tara:strand:+ start:214 stop:552 length:339 start_codon:yes stop_codon:yes gene_type:complete